MDLWYSNETVFCMFLQIIGQRYLRGEVEPVKQFPYK